MAKRKAESDLDVNMQFVNKVGRLEVYVPFKKLMDLDEAVTYAVEKFENRKTPFGDQIVVFLREDDDEEDNEEVTSENVFQVYLPKRFGKYYKTEEDVKKLTNTIKYMNFLGFKNEKYPIIEFR